MGNIWYGHRGSSCKSSMRSPASISDVTTWPSGYGQLYVRRFSRFEFGSAYDDGVSSITGSPSGKYAYRTRRPSENSSKIHGVG